MSIWIIAIGLAAFVGVLLIVPSLRRAPDDIDPETEAAKADIQVYRDQIKELDRDQARGIISAEDAAQAKLEVSRRLLEADAKTKTAQAAIGVGSATKYVLAVLVVAMVGGAVWLYSVIGSPSYQDMPLQVRYEMAQEVRENRISQAEAEAQIEFTPQGAPEHLALLEQLRAALVERPDDLYGYQLLADNEAQIGNLAGAHRAQAQIIRLKGDEATLQDFVTLADYMIVATNGYVSPEAEQVLLRIQAIDPQNEVFRFYAGMMFAQTGRPDVAFNYWSALLNESEADDPWVPIIMDQIDILAQIAGVRYTPPSFATAPGPDADAIAAAQDMTPEERMEMIQGMVDGLSQRLATEGGTADEWARLIGALGVLGDTDRAAAIWGEAQQLFAEVPGDLAMIRAAAVQAGVAE